MSSQSKGGGQEEAPVFTQLGPWRLMLKMGFVRNTAELGQL